MKESINIKQILISVLFTWFGLKCVTFKNTMLFIWTDFHSNNDKWFFFLVGVYLDKAPWIIYRIFYEPPTVRSFVGFKKFVLFLSNRHISTVFEIRHPIICMYILYKIEYEFWRTSSFHHSKIKNEAEEKIVHMT